MVVIDTHTVQEEVNAVRMVDYAIGIFIQTPTKNSVKKAIKRNEICLNNRIAKEGDWIHKGDVIELIDTGSRIPKAYNLDVEIIYEDDYIVVVNKPAGLVVSGNQFRTLENSMVGKGNLSEEMGHWKWLKPVHRLDASTSGLLVMSKSNEAHIAFANLFSERKISKKYIAIVAGVPSPEKGMINTSINDQECVSEYEVINVVSSLRSGKMSMIQLYPRTGRTHQLRIHCASIGVPIIGDILYGEKGNTLLHKGLFLSAVELNFIHPMTGEDLSISIKIPHKFEALLQREQKRWEKYNPK